MCLGETRFQTDIVLPFNYHVTKKRLKYYSMFIIKHIYGIFSKCQLFPYDRDLAFLGYKGTPFSFQKGVKTNCLSA